MIVKVKGRVHMLDKFKNKLKLKISNWLELDRINENTKRINQCEINYYNYKIKINHELNENTEKINQCEVNHYNYKHKVNHELHEKDNQIDVINKTLQSVISIGADVAPNKYAGNRSWAVVCIEGKRGNVVKFMDLQGQDYRYILDFLKQFECGRRVIDAPHREMFVDSFIFK